MSSAWLTAESKALSDSGVILITDSANAANASRAKGSSLVSSSRSNTRTSARIQESHQRAGYRGAGSESATETDGETSCHDDICRAGHLSLATAVLVRSFIPVY